MAETMTPDGSASDCLICLKCGGQNLKWGDRGKQADVVCAECGTDIANLETDRDGPVICRDAYNVGPLIAAGKLTVAKGPAGRIFAWHNRPLRQELADGPRELTAVDKVEILKGAFDKIAGGIMTVIGRAIFAGGRVIAYLHGGTISGKDNDDYRTANVTNDFWCVITGHAKQPGPADGLIFLSVRACARCGQDHGEPLGFWQFKNPPCQEDGSCYTHFGFCPILGEPLVARYHGPSGGPIAVVQTTEPGKLESNHGRADHVTVG